MLQFQTHNKTEKNTFNEDSKRERELKKIIIIKKKLLASDFEKKKFPEYLTVNILISLYLSLFKIVIFLQSSLHGENMSHAWLTTKQSLPQIVLYKPVGLTGGKEKATSTVYVHNVEGRLAVYLQNTK